MKITAYQILSITRCLGHTDVIPDSRVYGTLEEAQEDINYRLEIFEKEGEKVSFKGVINSLFDIEKIFVDMNAKLSSYVEEKIEFYIYEVEVLV